MLVGWSLSRNRKMSSQKTFMMELKEDTKDKAQKFLIFCMVLIMAIFIIRAVNTPSGEYFRTITFHTSIDSAVLAAFESTSSPPDSTSILRYDLSVNITVTGPKLIRFQIRDTTVTALYNGSMLGVPSTWIAAKNRGEGSFKARKWPSSFGGTVAVYPSVASELQRERQEGTVHVRLRVSLTTVYYAFFYNNYDCWLWFPPPGVAAPAIFGEGTKCWPAK